MSSKVGKNLSAEVIELPVETFFGREGLKAPCRATGCDGLLVMVRTGELKLRNGAYCTLCGQRYRFDSTFEGSELEAQLRGLLELV